MSRTVRADPTSAARARRSSTRGDGDDERREEARREARVASRVSSVGRSVTGGGADARARATSTHIVARVTRW